jgi:c-di-GMP-binding flagellar brake protein YcgR
MKEKRKYRRVKFGIEFIYKVMGVKGEATLTSVDLGGRGMRLYLDRKMDAGVLVELGLRLPGDKQIFFSLGKVAWQNKAPETVGEKKGRYLTGLEFMNLDIANRTRLIRFVHEKIKEGKDAA